MDKQGSAPNPLGVEKIGTLLARFAVPSIIGMLVSALYNIVDQVFIGQKIGILGNAATGVTFPFSTISTAIHLLLGIGCASNFNLQLGAGNKEKASQIVSNAITLLVACGLCLCLVVQLFLEPMIIAFGASKEVLPHALTYGRIIGFGLPFLIVSGGLSNIIRADGSPTYSMFFMAVGAAVNTVLDPLFMFGLGMDIEGAAYATVISQVISCALAVGYLFRFRSVKLIKKNFMPKAHVTKMILALGAASSLNQLAMTAVQVTMSNTLRHYGALSPYGSEIPLACVGVITKVNIVMMAFIIGTSQGGQPIMSFNYGAKKYSRVKAAYFRVAGTASIMAICFFLCFQLFPRQIISIFGGGGELYYQFAERYMHIYMFMAFAVGIQPTAATFFTSINKAFLGMFVSLTRQFLFLIPLILLFPTLWGIDGVMYAGPIADTAALILALLLIFREIKKISALQAQQPGQGGLAEKNS